MPHPTPLALYVHIPWCVKKCPYCDFNSHGLKGRLPETEYVAALLADLDADLAEFADGLDGRTIETVFFGGGTPSLFAPAAIGAVLDGVAARLRLAPDAEVTLETNPGTVEHGRFKDYRAVGVNRISFGVQSFDDDALRRIGRIHGAEEARRAVRLAQDDGIDNINLDLMYALPGQLEAGALADVAEAVALADVAEALALGPQHVSHYQLTLEPNTLFAARPPKLPDDDAAWDMQERCQAALADAGYAQYEVSAYARPGRQCRHNLNYWRFGDYLGIGAGAHGKLTAPDGTIRRTWKQKHPERYLATAGGAERLGGNELVAAEQRPFEYMLNALRLNEGFSLRAFEARAGLPSARIAPELERCARKGWLERDQDLVRPTELGRRFLNDVMAEFLP
jgi:oxygen-independent coproporphyrinogen-3 oxidase